MAEENWRAFLAANWHLGFTAFGGPPVHFKIFHDRFVVKRKWIDEQFFQELFSVSQSLSGPASTKMLYCINLVRFGTPAAILSFFFWTLPAATAMFGLSLGVASIDTTLPGAAYALLSGLNASVVGVIALATTELSGKAITDSLTRMIVFTAASAGMLYNALWYFPALMAGSGLVALVHDMGWVHQLVRLLAFWRRRTTDIAPTPENGHETPGLETGITDANGAVQESQTVPENGTRANSGQDSAADEPRIIPEALRIDVSWKAGAVIIASFVVSFLTIVIVRAVLPDPPRLYALFANMYLAGTIIFGGGPVVIPLLREYIVAEGWVSQRDFLIGLAIIQAFPGPNFNFAVFLGSLTAANAGYSPPLGAVLAWLGVFTPGMVLVHGIMGLWSALRNRRPVRAILRGINAGAVGLIYTVVYRIWQVGFLDETAQQGRSLGDDPWWLVVAAANYVFGRWYRVSPPITIIAGALMGLLRYAVITALDVGVYAAGAIDNPSPAEL